MGGSVGAESRDLGARVLGAWQLLVAPTNDSVLCSVAQLWLQSRTSLHAWWCGRCKHRQVRLRISPDTLRP